MNTQQPPGAIHVKDLLLWGHVGVLETERCFGQWFSLNFSILIDLDEAAKKDNLDLSVDYSIAIKGLQQLSLTIICLTIEHFSEKIFDYLESLYGPVPMHLILTKCHPPISGFNGTVAVERSRNLVDFSL